MEKIVVSLEIVPNTRARYYAIMQSTFNVKTGVAYRLPLYLNAWLGKIFMAQI
jgi:hypothetical protein